jgi:4-amino-4-deoxy-L-arabinose transferase-like glycosyltransferase
VGAFQFAQLGRPLGNGDEVIYAQNIREMLRSDDCSILQWQGMPVFQRPAWPFCLAALGTYVAAEERGLRLSSFLFGLCILCLVYHMAMSLWARRDLAAMAVLLCGSAPSFFFFSSSLLSDPPFVAALVLALAGTLRGDHKGLLTASLGMGLAVACKSLAAGPAMVALGPWLLVAAWRLPNRRGRTWVLCLLLFLIPAAPFYLIGFARHGWLFMEGHFGYSLVARAKGELAVGMPGGVTAYLAHLIGVDGWPVALWVVGASLGLLVVSLRQRERESIVLSSFGLAYLLVLSVIGTRLAHYLLPVYPAAAVCSAGLFGRVVAPWRPAAMVRRLWLGPALALVLFSLGLERVRQAELAFLPHDANMPIGQAAGRITPEGEAVHLLEWYGPAVAYYADRDLRLLTADAERFRILDDVDFFREAGVVVLVPPPPMPVGMALTVVGPVESLHSTPWLRVERSLDRVGNMGLVRGRVMPDE